MGETTMRLRCAELFVERLRNREVFLRIDGGSNLRNHRVVVRIDAKRFEDRDTRRRRLVFDRLQEELQTPRRAERGDRQRELLAGLRMDVVPPMRDQRVSRRGKARRAESPSAAFCRVSSSGSSSSFATIGTPGPGVSFSSAM